VISSVGSLEPFRIKRLQQHPQNYKREIKKYWEDPTEFSARITFLRKKA
jgi:hypothetical protein